MNKLLVLLWIFVFLTGFFAPGIKTDILLGIILILWVWTKDENSEAIGFSLGVWRDLSWNRLLGETSLIFLALIAAAGFLKQKFFVKERGKIEI